MKKQPGNRYFYRQELEEKYRASGWINRVETVVKFPKNDSPFLTIQSKRQNEKRNLRRKKIFIISECSNNEKEKIIGSRCELADQIHRSDEL